MAPERPRGPLDPRLSPREDRRVEVGRKLHRPAEKGRGPHDLGQGLQQPQGRVRLHPRHQMANGLSLHQAVGVQDHHVIISGPGTSDEVLDIAGLAAAPVGPVAVEHPRAVPAVGQQRREGRALALQRIGIERVGQDGEIDAKPGGQRGVADRRKARGTLDGILVADGHEHGGRWRALQHRRHPPPAQGRQTQEGLRRPPGQPSGGHEDQRDTHRVPQPEPGRQPGLRQRHRSRHRAGRREDKRGDPAERRPTGAHMGLSAGHGGQALRAKRRPMSQIGGTRRWAGRGRSST